MSVVSDAPGGHTDAPAVVPFGPAMGVWAVAWVVGGAVLGAAAIVIMGANFDDPLTIPQTGVAALVGWASFIVALGIASRRYGTGDMAADYAIRFRPIDLVGIPIGVVTQFVLVPVLYLPLRGAWPDTFSRERLEENARELADRAGGLNTVVLVVIVVVGAPIVEELVYRGLIQRSTASLIGVWPALVATSMWFAIIHFRPIEYPGLFLAGLVFGACVVATGRLGPAIVTHAAFNAAGIINLLVS